ncbi:hypothetical protein [Desulfotruncus arcticus]
MGYCMVALLFSGIVVSLCLVFI